MSDDELVRRYLLGDLPGDEAEELERRLLSEDDLFELAEAVEADVLDDYARGELAPAQRQRVESYLAVSPEGRLRLAVIQDLAKVKPEGRLILFPRLSPEERPQVRAAAIAAMFVIACSTVLLMQVQPKLPPPREAKHQIPIESPIPFPTQTPPPAPQDRVVTTTPTPTPAPRPLVVFVANIPLLAQRSNDVVPSFDIPERTDVIELRFQLREGEDRGYPSYQVAMELVDTGEEVTENEGLRVKKSSGLLIVRVDASRFEEGRYSLTIQGVPSQGEPVNIELSEFEVRRQ